MLVALMEESTRFSMLELCGTLVPWQGILCNACFGSSSVCVCVCVCVCVACAAVVCAVALPSTAPIDSIASPCNHEFLVELFNALLACDQSMLVCLPRTLAFTRRL